ncbi:MAG: hypothetical protein IPK17_17945 [Chloroflexi bacterium]|uniref:hypothetical protein n=1 Tax=Candidatus Flexifilum breve TaxID=3140694 RepID=UPI003136E4DF|nr:hypothetical protein [Chloroflexota bacterium]
MVSTSEQQHEFIGTALLELDPAPQRAELMRQRDALVKDLLREGREHLKTRSPFRAYDPFDKAALLAPREAYIPLAAGWRSCVTRTIASRAPSVG